MAHDANLPATSSKAIEQLEILKLINGGLVQGIVPPMSFTTALFYGIPLELGSGAASAQIFGMTVTFALALILAVTGFDHLLAHWGRLSSLSRKLDACLLGALYLVAPFTLAYISYGAFWMINIALAIGVMPLLFHLFLRCFVDEQNEFKLRSIATLTLCLIVVAWSILFIFPTILIFIGLICLRGGVTKQDVAKCLVLGLLLFLGSLSSLYGMYLSVFDAGWQTATDTLTSNAAYGSIQGGVLTGFLQYSAWPIYTPWTPRLLLGFPSHFFSVYYISLTILLLAIVIAIPLVNNQGMAMKRYLYVALMLLVAVFFVKGGGQPFGLVFKAILSNVPGGGLIRTPDTKFGVFVILAIAIALTIALANGDQALFRFRFMCRLVIMAVVAYHAELLVNGQAILAVNSELAVNQSDRGYVVTVTPAERLIMEALQHEPTAGVVVLPPLFGLTTRREGGVFSYRNVIGDFVPNALYYSGWNDMPNAVKEHLRLAVDEGAWTLLPELGVGFLLLNRNGLSERANQYEIYHAVRNAPQAWVKVVDEGGYELYRLNDEFRKPLVSIATTSGESALQVIDRRNWFAFVHPGPLADRFAVTFRSAENKHWRLVVIPGSCAWDEHLCAMWGLLARSAAYWVQKDLSPNDLVNRWNIEKRLSTREKEAETLGAGPDSIAIIFVPQLVMYLFLGLSVAIALLCMYFMRHDSLTRKKAQHGAVTDV